MEQSERVAFVQKKITTFTTTEDIVIDALAEVEQSIKNYCAVATVPDALHFVWCRMAVDLLTFDHEMATNSSDVLDAIDASDVSAIKIGDTSISLGGKSLSNQRSRVLQSHLSNLDDIVTNFRAQLNLYRRIW